MTFERDEREQTDNGNVAVIKAIGGSFAEGFPIVVQIGKEGSAYSCERSVSLEPAPKLPPLYDRWLDCYRKLGLTFRLEAIDEVAPVQNLSRREDCLAAEDELHRAFQQWLQCESFRAASEAIWQHCSLKQPLRLIVQTADPYLQQLPWCIWYVLERFPRADIGLSSPNYERVSPPPFVPSQTSHQGIQVLALVGDPTGIDPQADIEALTRHPTIAVDVKSAPTLKQLTDSLWSNAWDVLLFSGHSSSRGGRGWMALDANIQVEIADLKGALQQSIRQGLQLAILNSCDGLGLASVLAELNVPQAIVMRAPIPDRVASAFLNYFLTAFTRSGEFYTAVREARERLQALEDLYPCASWLPVIIQNPAARSLTWSDLCGAPLAPSPRGVVLPPQTDERPQQPKRHRWLQGSVALLASAIATVGVLGMRATGSLEAWELTALDGVMRLQPPEPLDPRVLVVTLSKTDIERQPQGGHQQGASLSDESLSLLLQKLESYQPRAIGLDIYRDFPASEAVPNLAAQLQQSDRLVVVCKVSDGSVGNVGIDPPPEVLPDRWGFSDFLVDRDGVLRRHLISMTPEPTSTCATPYAFSAQLGFRYLAAEGISASYSSSGVLQLGERVVTPLRVRPGGYRTVDLWGDQILLSYRTLREGEPSIRQVSMLDVLSDRLNPEFARNRVVLIGTTAPSEDFWTTPFSTAADSAQEMAGVMVQAQATGQLLAAALNERPLLVPLSRWQEGAWIWGGAWLGSTLALLLRRPLWIGTGGAIALTSLGSFATIALGQWGWWIPIVPIGLAGLASAGGVGILTTRMQQSVKE